MALTEVRLQNFRSFSDETVLRFHSGLNVLVGANGTGKSNVLDGVLFALTQEASKLRARWWAELQHRDGAKRGPCAVALRICPPGGKGQPDVAIMAHLKDDCSRQLKLNGKPATIAEVRAALREVRLEVEDTTFAIRQNAASRVLDSEHLIGQVTWPPLIPCEPWLLA